MGKVAKLWSNFLAIVDQEEPFFAQHNLISRTSKKMPWHFGKSKQNRGILQKITKDFVIGGW